jgi:hypothetical protein
MANSGWAVDATPALRSTSYCTSNSFLNSPIDAPGFFFVLQLHQLQCFEFNSMNCREMGFSDHDPECIGVLVKISLHKLLMLGHFLSLFAEELSLELASLTSD